MSGLNPDGLGPSETFNNADAKSVTTEKLNNVVYISPNDDIQQRVTDAGSQAHIILEPNADYKVSNLTTEPQQFFWGWNTSILKNADGRLMTIKAENRFYGIIFDGVSASQHSPGYTGPGVVDGVSNPQRIRFEQCYFIFHEGNARVMDGGARWVYDQCRWSNNESWAVEMIANNSTDAPRRGEFRRCRMQDQPSGGVLCSSSNPVTDIRFFIDILNASGPGYEFQSGGSNILIGSSIRNADGPAILGKPLPDSLRIVATLKNNVGSPSGLTSPAGTIHQESGAGSKELHLMSGKYAGNSDSNNSLYSNQSGGNNYVHVGMPNVTGSYSIDGNSTNSGFVFLTAPNADVASNLSFGTNVQGYTFEPASDDGCSITDLKNNVTFFIGNANDTNDGMTADPETATEDGYLNVDIGGTSYQIPVYQA